MYVDNAHAGMFGTWRSTVQILFKMTITASVNSVPTRNAVDIEKKLDWPPDLRMPVKDDVIDFGGMTKAVEEVHLHPTGIGVYATVYLENFIDPDPSECAEVDFSDWTMEP
jgi:hypothetical protein